MIKRTIHRCAKILCVSAIVLGGLSLNGCVFVGGHGGHGWHHHEWHDHGWR